MATRDVVCIGASAGGVDVLRRLVRALPKGLPASVLIVLHVSPASPSLLPLVLGRHAALTVTHAVDGMRLAHGTVFVAPPDRHLTVDGERVRVIDGPQDKFHRPSVDVLFRSAAAAFGHRVIGVVVSGALDDGTNGLAAIKRHGGLAIVQDPKEAAFSGMPSSALANVAVDHCATIRGIAQLLDRLTRETLPEEASTP